MKTIKVKLDFLIVKNNNINSYSILNLKEKSMKKIKQKNMKK